MISWLLLNSVHNIMQDCFCIESPYPDLALHSQQFKRNKQQNPLTY